MKKNKVFNYNSNNNYQNKVMKKMKVIKIEKHYFKNLNEQKKILNMEESLNKEYFLLENN